MKGDSHRKVVKENRVISILLLDPGNTPLEVLRECHSSKPFSFGLLGRLRGQNQEVSTETDHSKYLLFNSNSQAKSRMVVIESPRVLLSKDVF